MVVARLLTPEEIGTFAIASAIVMVMAEIRLLGAGAYLIRESEITPAKVRSTLGLTLIVSWSMGLLVLLSALPAARFYELSELGWIFAILSISFFIAPYISIPMTLLARNLCFKHQFRILAASSIISSATTIGMVLSGFSFWSLAVGQLLNPLSQFLIFCLYRPYLMQYWPSFRNLKPIARIGIFNSLTFLIRRATVAAPDMIIGKAGSTRDVAMFSRGLGFIEFVSQTVIKGVQPVAFPYLSQVRREGGNLLEAYTRASVMLGAFVVPILGVGSIASLPTIRLFFGDQWDAAAPLASIVAIWAMCRSVHWFSRELLMGSGREDLMLLREALPFFILIPLILLAYPYGLQAVAVSFLATGVVDVIFTSVLLWKVTGLNLIYFFRSWIGNVATLMSCMGTTWAWSQVVSFQATPPVTVVLLLALTTPFVWLGTLGIFRNPLYFEIRDAIPLTRNN
ncbi:O-antigen/teichoic acid export membrane protein [Tamilnaduibacter salinus]|uniref:O-antigen/teichoic acid export membrane protein n=2 Tax=Tamilnaduibacter salinus TaxID=1484056 RepID=A0A2U1CZV3_9GAMM|nr:O-antigen/teichoic acid export membrane protein [Tamilnaduibacter salinus]